MNTVRTAYRHIPILVPLLLTSVAWSAGAPEISARAILDATGVKGGLVVHLGCGDGQTIVDACACQAGKQCEKAFRALVIFPALIPQNEWRLRLARAAPQFSRCSRRTGDTLQFDAHRQNLTLGAHRLD